MSRTNYASAWKEEDLVVARADAEARYVATRHSSESEDLSTSENGRARKSRRLKKRTRRAERNVRWPEPEQDGRCFPYTHFEQWFREQANMGARANEPTVSAVETWHQLSSLDRERYEALTSSYRSEYMASMAIYNAQVPLSPSLRSKSSTSESSDPNMGPKDSNHEISYARTVRHEKHNRRRASQCWNRYWRVHPRACGIITEPIPTTPFPFIALPTEVRSQILNMLLQRENILRQRVGVSDDDPDEKPVDTRLFAVSIAMRDEAEAVFYSNKFRVFVHEDKNLPEFIQFSRPSSIQYMKEVQVLRRVYPYVDAYVDLVALEAKFETLCGALKQCSRLRKLRLTVIGNLAWSDTYSEQDTDFDKILRPFASLRGITSVSFDSEVSTLSGRPLGTKEQQVARLKAIMESQR